MVQVNSWGRKIKDIFSVTFKKDEEHIKLYLNEQAAPAAYIKELILKDMGNKRTLETYYEKPAKDIEENKNDEENLTSEAPKITGEAAERLKKIMEG